MLTAALSVTAVTSAIAASGLARIAPGIASESRAPAGVAGHQVLCVWTGQQPDWITASTLRSKTRAAAPARQEPGANFFTKEVLLANAIQPALGPLSLADTLSASPARADSELDVMARGTYNLMPKRLSLCLLQASVRSFEL
ncbi:hypothetical protein EHS25_003972 [Saitozyma podzolica]|uniref:Uncharacterized protein n=1 Tax=Saitozyma podzolica TaxID=1890683 RepID=A0A427YSW4_9TREE|nr:hypothetical protein EHS25_003972 [Saitozyma podzolica]